MDEFGNSKIDPADPEGAFEPLDSTEPDPLDDFDPEDDIPENTPLEDED